tara:strand:- start:1051 stop:1767 length:717 start_codon:yes stop_codon:yes gene_type:complete
MFIPDYLGDDVWALPFINREHYKIQKVLNLNEDDKDTSIKNLPWVELGIGYSWQTWEKEIKKLEELHLFKTHKNEFSKGWKHLTLYDSEWNSEVTENCYHISKWFKDIFLPKYKLGEDQKIEIMALESQGYIELHKNKETDKHNFNVIKFSLEKPIGYSVSMFNPNPMDKTKLKDKDYIGRIPCETGKALQLDSGNYFTARNLSEQTAYYIVAQINTFDFKQSNIKQTIGNIKRNARI